MIIYFLLMGGLFFWCFILAYVAFFMVSNIKPFLFEGWAALLPFGHTSEKKTDQLIGPPSLIKNTPHKNALISLFFWVFFSAISLHVFYLWQLSFIFSENSPYLSIGLWCGILILTVFVDGKTQFIPDCITFSFIGVGLLSAAIPNLPIAQDINLSGLLPLFQISLQDSILGACGVFAATSFIQAIITQVKPNGMFGGGDIKFLSGCGAWLGFTLGLYILVSALVLSLMYRIMQAATEGGATHENPSDLANNSDTSMETDPFAPIPDYTPLGPFLAMMAIIVSLLRIHRVF